MSDIGVATADRSPGLEPVEASVLQLDQMTQPNVAVFEKAAASAEGLNHWALLLMQAVSALQLPIRLS
ncbi:hypothetical protein [Paucibacter sp. B51]|uniref:hypothetical protein n=1 Tax=Paucibacter sp. B51 TaxID=2993315 RepID=UPI0022EC15F2|nr:hypothetical protein [Paucibacter sp. B51]